MIPRGRPRSRPLRASPSRRAQPWSSATSVASLLFSRPAPRRCRPAGSGT